jgi:hypothetical protein
LHKTGFVLFSSVRSGAFGSGKQLPKTAIARRKRLCKPGLPDGFKPKSQFRYILGFGMDNVGVFYSQLVHFMAIWYIL